MEKEQLQQEEELEIDLAELFSVVLKRWKFVACSVLIGAVLGGLYFTYAFFACPRYESTALLRVKSSKSGFGANPLDAIMGGGQFAEQQVATYAEILTSHSVLDPVIKQVREDCPELSPLSLRYEKFIKSRLKVEPVKTSDLLKVTTNAGTAEYAQKLNNYVVEAFQSKLINLSRLEQRTLGKFLKERLQQAKQEVNDFETKLREFLVTNKYFTPGDRADFLSARLIRLDNEIAANEIAESVNISGLNIVKKQLAEAGIINVAQSGATEKIRNEITALEVERIHCIDKYTDKHPSVQVIQNQINELRKKLDFEIKKVVQLRAPSVSEIHQKLIGSKLGHEAALVSIKHKKELLKKLSEQYDKDIEKLPVLDQEYVLLKRDAHLAGEIYTMLAKRYEEAKIAEAMEIGDVQVIDFGDLPEEQRFPRWKRCVVIFAFLGGLFSVGRITWQFIYRATINTEDDVTKHLGLPVIASIPEEESLANTQRAEEKKELLKKISLKIFSL